MEKETISNLVKIIGKFKDLKRSGWIKRGVILPESDADHSFSVAFLALLTAPKTLNLLKCLKLALVHDIAEIYAGDVTPVDNVSKEEKYKNEVAAIKRVAKELNCQELEALFEEFEGQNSLEAKFIKAIDKIDNVVSAKYYDDNMRGNKKLVPEFGDYANKQISLIKSNDIEEIKQILQELRN